MGYPKNLLTDGETIAIELKPHWRALFFPLFILVVVVAVGIFLFIITPVPIVQMILGAIGLVILVWFVLFPFMRWLTTQYVFTSRRIILREGLLTKKGRDIPLSKVNGISHETPFLGRILNYGALQIESANEDGAVYIADVPNVEEIQREIYVLMENNDARRTGND
jgi:uncharacterized membrane protein YdbT with pleckstrin-like domain